MTGYNRLHLPWPAVALLVTIGLPLATGLYWLGDLSSVVTQQGTLIARLDTRMVEFEKLIKQQAERDKAQDEAFASARLELTRLLIEQTGVMREQAAETRAIRDRLGPAPGTLGPR